MSFIMIREMRSLIVLAFTIISVTPAVAQQLGQDTDAHRAITPAVPFLLIAPDARGGAMGDAGAALSPDANANHWNIGKLAFIENDFGFSFSYTPWLGKIFDDMHIAYLTGYYKIDDVQAVSGSMRYFNMGSIQFMDMFGKETQPRFQPQEVALDIGYSRKLSKRLGLGVTGRFIHSDLAGDISSSIDARPGQSLAADIGLYYNNPDLRVNGTDSELGFAVVIANIGNKITYLSEDQESFIPTNLKVGTAYKANLDPYNSLTIAVDLNKLMIPSPPIYQYNPDGSPVKGPDGKPVPVGNYDPNRSLINGMFTSFVDAPDGFSEELKEITVSAGVEYWYNDLFAARAGYFYEHDMKGGRKFFTIGAGLRYQLFLVDFAYLIPTQQQHPLAETLRVTLGVNFNKAVD